MVLRLVSVALTLVLLSGCALTVDEIDVPYERQNIFVVVPNANTVKVAVVGIDQRTKYRDRVSVKKNGYGMEMAPIVATNDLARTFQSAVEFELKNAGFEINSGGKVIDIGLSRFYNDFKIGFFAGDAVADGLVHLSVRDGNGNIMYSKTYEGSFKVTNVQLAMGHNAREALIGAMADIIAKIAQDRELHFALLK